MSNSELRRVNERQNLERNYKTANPNVVKKGIIALGAVAATLGTITAIQKNGGKIIKSGKKIVSATLDTKVGKKVASGSKKIVTSTLRRIRRK